jgi:hypothetical protein
MGAIATMKRTLNKSVACVLRGDKRPYLPNGPSDACGWRVHLRSLVSHLCCSEVSLSASRQASCLLMQFRPSTAYLRHLKKPYQKCRPMGPSTIRNHRGIVDGRWSSVCMGGRKNACNELVVTLLTRTYVPRRVFTPRGK